MKGKHVSQNTKESAAEDFQVVNIKEIKVTYIL